MEAQAVGDLPTNLGDIVGAFQMVPDAMARYKQLLFFASKLDPLPEEFHTDENRVRGCVSQVWVKASIDDGCIQFQADSDSQLTKAKMRFLVVYSMGLMKGLAALLVKGLSGSTPKEILAIQPDFIEALGLKQSLTPSRNNGFLNMFRMMQKRTLELASADLKKSKATDASGNGSPPPDPSATPVEDAIRRKITDDLEPEELEINNDSEQHAGHSGNPNGAGETHFTLRIVSSKFEGMKLVQRQRRVFALLKEELDGPVHACSMETKTPQEVLE